MTSSLTRQSRNVRRGTFFVLPLRDVGVKLLVEADGSGRGRPTQGLTRSRPDLPSHRAEQIREVAGDQHDPDGPPGQRHTHPVGGGGELKAVRL